MGASSDTPLDTDEGYYDAFKRRRGQPHDETCIRKREAIGFLWELFFEAMPP